MSHDDKSIVDGVDERVKTGLLKLHSDFLKKNLLSKKFNFSYVETEESALASYLSAKKISWKDALEMAGLSYDHHRGQMIYGKTDDERKETFKLLISHIVELVGGNYSVLSDGAMNVQISIPLPKKLLISKSHLICEHAGCKIFTITKQSVYAQGSRLFGDWGQAIAACDIDYKQDVLKKIASRALLETILMLDEFDRRHNDAWSFQDIRRENSVLERALHNAFKKYEGVPFAELSNQKVAVMVANLRYWRETGELKTDIDWWNRNKEQLLEQYNVNHRSQETWSIGKIQSQVLSRYASGENLSRPELDSDSAGKTLLAALRSPRWGEGAGELGTLKRVGILTPQLSSLQSIIDDTPLEVVLVQLRGLVAESLEDGENKLTREYVQNNHYELMTAASRWHRRLTKSRNTGIDWAGVLKFFGLNPNVFSISASDRSNRGFVFQRFVKDILSKYMIEKDSHEEVSLPTHFCSDKLMKNHMCDHFIRCKPDFYLGDTIIDTKVGGTLAKPEQLERYLDHADRVFIVTINDKAKVKKLENGSVEIIKLAAFLERSLEIVGVEIPPEEINGLSQVLKDAVDLTVPPKV
jgi:hypothetical protein